MKKNSIQTTKAPGAIGPYSQAISTGDTLYISGQLPVDPKTGIFAGNDIETQTQQSLENIKAILTKTGTDMNAIVKTTVFLQNMTDFTAMNEIYAKYFTAPFPARAAVQVACLPKGARIEIEAIAVL